MSAKPWKSPCPEELSYPTEPLPSQAHTRPQALICMCPVCAGDRCQPCAAHLAEAKHGHSRLDGPSGICIGVLCQADPCGATWCSAWRRPQNCQPVHCDAAGYPRPVCRRGKQQSTVAALGADVVDMQPDPCAALCFSVCKLRCLSQTSPLLAYAAGLRGLLVAEVNNTAPLLLLFQKPFNMVSHK